MTTLRENLMARQPTGDAGVRHQAEEAMVSFGVPGMVISYRKGLGRLSIMALGVDAEGRPLDAESLFPVASVTKLATALLILQLCDQGAVALDAAVSTYLPEAHASRPGVTVRRLLCHTAGLPLDIDISWVKSVSKVDWNSFARACLATHLVHPAGQAVQYSNVGYGLLAIVAERVASSSFRTMLATRVLRPLGIDGYIGIEPARQPIAVKDIRGNGAGTPDEPYTSLSWCALGLPWGGLVTTADGALALVQAFRPGSNRIVSEALLAEARTNQTGDLSGGFVPPLVWRPCPWGLGPDLRGDKSPHWAPAVVSRLTYGHSGSSGAIAYCDPATDIAWSILGARTADNGWLVRSGPRIAEAIILGVTS